jgi:hypothetical protein
MKALGYGLLVGGAILQTAEIMAKQTTNAAQGGQPFAETALGKFVAPIESKLPLSLGWTLVVIGAILVWVAPHLGIGGK